METDIPITTVTAKKEKDDQRSKNSENDAENKKLTVIQPPTSEPKVPTGEGDGYTDVDHGSLNHHAAKKEKDDQRSKNSENDAENENLTGTQPPTSEPKVTTGEANGYTDVDHGSLNHHAGCGDGQAVEPENGDMATSDQFCDIYLVYTRKGAPHVDKIKDMCERNKWKFTTPFSGRLGLPAMQSRQENIQACSCVVFFVTEDDMNNKDFRMTTQMAYQCKMEDEIIPIRSSKEVELPLWLRCLEGSFIGEDDLEKRMIETIRMKRKALCHSVSGATFSFDACEDEEEGVGDTFDSVNTSAACSGAKFSFDACEDEEEGVGDTFDSVNTSAACSGNAVLTDIYFMELAGQSGSEWEDIVKKYILQCVQQSTPV